MYCIILYVDRMCFVTCWYICYILTLHRLALPLRLPKRRHNRRFASPPPLGEVENASPRCLQGAHSGKGPVNVLRGPSKEYIREWILHF